MTFKVRIKPTSPRDKHAVEGLLFEKARGWYDVADTDLAGRLRNVPVNFLNPELGGRVFDVENEDTAKAMDVREKMAASAPASAENARALDYMPNREMDRLREERDRAGQFAEHADKAASKAHTEREAALEELRVLRAANAAAAEAKAEADEALAMALRATAEAKAEAEELRKMADAATAPAAPAAAATELQAPPTKKKP